MIESEPAAGGKGIDRRGLLQVVLGSLAGTALWPAVPTAATLPLADLDRMAADAAKKRADGRSVTLRLLIPNGSQANVEPVIDAFAERTGIMVEAVVAAVDDINTKLMLDQMTGSESYDLALPATFGIPELAEGGALKDISDFVSTYEPSGLRAGSLYTAGDSYGGRIYGFQADGDAYLMFYNEPWLEDEDTQKRYADRFGQTLAVPETWEELDRQMAFFHEPAKNRFGGALFRTPGYVAWEWWVRYHAKGAWPFDSEMNPLIDGEAGITALEDLRAASGSLYPQAESAGLFENWDAFAKGNIYCNIGWGGTQKHLNGPSSKLRGKLAFSGTPGGIVDGGKLVTPYFNWGWNYVVTSRSREPEIAYLFALFASSPIQSTRSVSDPKGYFDPHRPEHYRQAAIIDAYSRPFLAAHETSMRSAIPDLYLDGRSEYFGALSEGIMAVLEGRSTAAQAMESTAKRWVLISHRLDPAKQRAQWQALQSRYPRAVADRLKPKMTAG